MLLITELVYTSDTVHLIQGKLTPTQGVCVVIAIQYDKLELGRFKYGIIVAYYHVNIDSLVVDDH